MRVMVMVKASPKSEEGVMPDPELMEAMGRFNEELVQAGIMKSGDGLKPSKEGVRIHFSGKNRSVSDGPFAETKELIAGYWIWEVASMEEAIAWAKKCPNPMPDDSDIEIRPFFEMADFQTWDPDGDWLAKEEGLRHTLVRQNGQVQPYLFFSGRCEEALAYYEKVLDAKVGMKLRYDQSPQPVPKDMLQPGFESKIMHSEFQVGKQTLFASDGCNDQGKLEGFNLVLTLENEETVRQTFETLASEGQVVMPLSPSFFTQLFGMVSDKFGVCWMVMMPPFPPQGGQA